MVSEKRFDQNFDKRKTMENWCSNNFHFNLLYLPLFVEEPDYQFSTGFGFILGRFSNSWRSITNFGFYINYYRFRPI